MDSVVAVQEIDVLATIPGELRAPLKPVFGSVCFGQSDDAVVCAEFSPFSIHRGEVFVIIFRLVLPWEPDFLYEASYHALSAFLGGKELCQRTIFGGLSHKVGVRTVCRPVYEIDIQHGRKE